MWTVARRSCEVKGGAEKQVHPASKLLMISERAALFRAKMEELQSCLHPFTLFSCSVKLFFFGKLLTLSF